MTRYLAANGSAEDVAAWLRLRGEIFADLPGQSAPDPAGWQRVFFRAQALMERFVVGRFGHDGLAGWTNAIAQVYRLVEPDFGGGAADPIRRFARQAELYASEYAVTQAEPEQATIEISHCAIWDYRERARARGVVLTLKSPCEFCTLATSANLEAKGYRSTFELLNHPSGPGCRWQATKPSGQESSCAG
ncbi:hypothetical protein AB0J84_10690 [Micromonospora arborensis]|uniref:hypothetical protein n=1 Tax=Micromonospora TaxID=1873 RepID=UPI0011B5217C|nr:hypothetical protein [Micromonospora arborensis]